MSQVLYEHPTHTTAATADLRHRNLAVASTPIMAAGSDPEPIEEPVATGDAKSHQSHSSSHSSATHYIGLPYQDHNYGAPPPPTPPQSPPPVAVPAAPVFSAGTNGILDVEKPVDVPNLIPTSIPTPAPEPVDHKDEGETRCICNYTHDDGYMICCDRCGVWQHVDCMGLDRSNIPDKFFCDKCQPRPVDRVKAHELQSKKRPFLIHSDSSSDSGDDEPSTATQSNTTTYMAISNSPTSLTLTTASKHKKLKKKKKKRSREKEMEDKHHKKKKRKHSRRPSTKSEGDAPSVLLDEETRPPWSDDAEDHNDRYEEAAFNQYSAEIQHLVATHCQKQAPSINSIRQPKLRTLGQRAEFRKLGKSSLGLVATEELKKNEFILEYKGKVMLSKQLDKLPFLNSPNPYVLMYSKFSKMDICIDANTYGNEARYVRRSCNPNAEIRHSFEDSTIHLSLYSLGHITNGSEITIGFDYNYKACSFPVRCACKKKNCVIKRLRRKHHSEDGQNHKAINHHLITRDELNKTKSNPEQLLTVPNNSKKRTVSPLRVSLSAHNAQNNAHPDSAPVNGDDSTTPEDTKKDPGTQENQESKEEQPPPPPAKKLTREERKMEAIMKAIEKMEKTEKRRQQALERIATSKQQQQDQKNEDGEKTEETETQETTGKEVNQKETAVKKDPQGRNNSASEDAVPPVSAKPRPNNRRRKKSAASRRRSRVNSAASTTTSGAEFSSMDEESNSTAPSTSNSSLGSNLLTMATKTPSAISGSLSLTVPSIMSGQLSDQQTMPSPVPACSKHFKFPKTKKFFMNEWLNEKALEASANNPLSIKTESLDVIAGSVSSPNTPTQLSKSASFTNLSTPLSKTNLEGSLSGSLGQLGSAKKRWLRQAMCDNNMKTGSGANSPVLNGALSPLHPASPALSPNSSASDAMMTPLKKRFLRHSIAEDRNILTQSSTPPPPEKASTAPSTPTTDNSVKLSSENKDGGATVKMEVDDNIKDVSRKVELLFDGHIEEKRSAVPCPLSLPARKDVRKNSSVDSGLSVTTPGYLEKSPISVTTDAPKLDVEGKIVPKVECKDISEVKSEERTSERTTNNDKQSPFVKEQTETPVKERHKSGDSASPIRQAVLSVKTEDPPAVDIQTPVRQPQPGGIGSSSAQVRLDFSLSESQGSLSNLERSQGSMPDLHSSCASAPELHQPDAASFGKTNLSQSASSANFNWTPVKKADSHSNVYSTPPRTRCEKFPEDDSIDHPRMRHQSGPGDFRRRHLSETETARRSSDGGVGFSDDQISGNTSLYTSFASPKKKTLMMMRNNEALGQEQTLRLDTVETGDHSRTLSKSLPNRTESEPDSLQLPDPPVSLSPAPSLNSPSLGASPNAGSTPPGPPALSPRRPFSPARSSGGVSPVLNSPGKLSMSPVPGSRLSPGSTAGLVAVASPTPGTPVTPSTPPVKRKVSLLEYRKRKTSSTGKTPSSSSSNSSSSTSVTTTTTPSSAPTTPIKPMVPTTPIKPTVPSTTKTGLPTLPTLPIFDLKTKAVAEETTKKGRRLSLTNDAVQAITSLTSFLKDKSKTVEKKKPAEEETWRSNKVSSNSNEDPLQKLRKELNEKNKERERRDSHERERRDSHNSLKRPRSPEPPPPPPSKKPSRESSHQPPAKKANSGLRLQIPPPPPPKAKSDSRSGDSSTESTPTKHGMNRPNLHRSPGSASTPPPARKPVPGTPPVRTNHGVPGTPPVRPSPVVPGTPPVAARPNTIQPTAYPQASTQAFNANFSGQQQAPAPQQPGLQYQHGVAQPFVPPVGQQVAQPAPPPVLPQQGLPQQGLPPQPQQQVLQQTVQQQPPPPPPQKAYNYQGYVNQQPFQEKQGTAAVIEQFTKFHNQQQQQHNQQYQQSVYNAAFQQTANYQAAPQQQQQQAYSGSQQLHYNAQPQQQHVSSNSYSPRRGGYYQ